MELISSVLSHFERAILVHEDRPLHVHRIRSIDVKDNRLRYVYHLLLNHGHFHRNGHFIRPVNGHLHLLLDVHRHLLFDEYGHLPFDVHRVRDGDRNRWNISLLTLLLLLAVCQLGCRNLSEQIRMTERIRMVFARFVGIRHRVWYVTVLFFVFKLLRFVTGQPATTVQPPEPIIQH
uniref:Uncharacterized protein n=1 Tax=Anopheles farauti TaxID=69004 RepID=A0A182QEY6_9DIPT